MSAMILTDCNMHPGPRTRAAVLRAAAIVALVGSLGGCRLVGPPSAARAESTQDVVSAAGWTRIATTEHYFVIANVLPGERMFTPAEEASEHPTAGELIILGPGNRLGSDVRHVEAHVYDRSTGLPLANVKLSIVLLNRTTGDRTTVSPTLMQDVNIGSADIHYGNNIAVAGNSDLTLTITIGDEEVTLDGHLD